MLFKDVRGAWGAVSPVLGLIDALVVEAVPITPLLRPLVTLLLLVFCTISIGVALSYSNDVPKDPTGNTRLRWLAALYSLLGLVFLAIYSGFIAYTGQHGTESQTLSSVLDILQAMLFVAPFAFWSAALVLVIPRK